MTSPSQTSRPDSTQPRPLLSASTWISNPAVLFRLGILLVVALYIRSISFDYVYDDLGIPVSPWIQSWHAIIDVFRSDIFGDAGKVGSSYYRPLASAMIVLIGRLTPATSVWFHLAAVLLAVVLYFVVFWFSRLLFENDLAAALTTLLFALHPTRVETVAWIGSAACDGQLAIYFFGLLGCYLQWCRTRKPGWLVASVVLFAAAMFTKETMAAVPVLIATHALLQSRPGERLRSTLFMVTPYLCVIGLYWLARHAVLRPLPKASIAIAPTFTSVNIWSAPSAFWWYIRELLAPYGVAILHDWAAVTAPSFTRFVLPLLAALALLVVVAWISVRQRSWRIPFLAAWFLLTLAPVIVFAPRVLVHDRYLLLPSYVFCAGLAYLLLWLARHQRVAAFTVSAVLIVVWSVLTWHAAGYWDNSVSLWQRAVQQAPHSINARLELARLYAAKDEPRAVQVLDDGLKLSPDSPGLWRTRGLLQFNAGELDSARASLERSLQVSQRFENPSSEPSDVKYGRATSAFFLGQIAWLQEDPAAAEPWLSMAVDIYPENRDYQALLIADLQKLGRNAEAEQHQKFVDALPKR